jgi:hypothetical protein
MSVSLEVTPPLRLYRTTAQGRHYCLNIYIGRDYLDQTNLPFFVYIRQIRSLRIRGLGWTLVAELMGGRAGAADGNTWRNSTRCGRIRVVRTDW